MYAQKLWEIHFCAYVCTLVFVKTNFCTFVAVAKISLIRHVRAEWLNICGVSVCGWRNGDVAGSHKCGLWLSSGNAKRYSQTQTGCIFICMYICTITHIYSYIYIYTYVLHARQWSCWQLHLHISVFTWEAHTHTHMYICVCVYIAVCKRNEVTLCGRKWDC